MPRKLRLDEADGLYHVLNRGNYRQWIFAEEGAKVAFEKALFEACERTGWLLHAFCIMGNHYHLALETPDGNLSEGMRWLQSVFANRFNRFHGEGGHLFQGRFKSLMVEDCSRLAWLCHYIHLNPARAGICPVAQLRNYRWSSLWYAGRPKSRPGFLRLTTCLEGAGDLADKAAGWRSYLDFLAWLQEDEPTRKQMEFDRMSWGSAIGSKDFRKALATDTRSQRAVVKLTQQEARGERELRWVAFLEQCLEVVGKEAGDASRERKGVAWKTGVAAFMKARLLTSNRWLAERLNMGAPTAVSRYAGEVLRGERAEASRVFELLSAKVKD